jgi:protein-tyrosine phosphatase
MTFRILYVCTGNICRSPLAERYTVHRLEQQPGEAAAGFEVGSVGVRALEGYPMDRLAEAELARRGGSGVGFVGRRMTASHIESADLVLTMTRSHRAAALTEAPGALRRTFTLLEAADLARLLAGDPGTESDARSGAGPAGLVAVMAAHRGRARLEDYDVADPIGRPAEVHAAVADVIASAVDDVAAFLTRTSQGKAREGDS